MLKDPRLERWTTRIGQRLRARRKSLGLSLEDLSRLSGATIPTLSNIERGKRDVKLSTLVSLAAALRTDLPSLFAEGILDGTVLETRDGSSGYDLDDD